jgi:hypothetical protein
VADTIHTKEIARQGALLAEILHKHAAGIVLEEELTCPIRFSGGHDASDRNRQSLSRLVAAQ